MSFYRLTPVSKPVNKRLVFVVVVLLLDLTVKSIHNTSKPP